MKKVLFSGLLCLFFLWSSLSAQLQFEETTHDFGLLFRGDPAKTTFVFHNVGKYPISLSNVKASCGCTTPIWTKEPVLPGQSGTIEVSYNSDLVGEFNKSIGVKWDSIVQPIHLFVKGQVIPRLGNLDTLDINDPIVMRMKSYNIQRTHIFLQSDIGDIGEVNSRELKRVEIPIANFSIRTVKFFPIAQDSDEVIISLPFTELRPGEESKIVVVIDGQRMPGSSAPFERKAKVLTDMRAADRVLEFRIVGSFLKMYTGTELAESPRIIFDAAYFDAGKIIEGDFINHDYVFRNAGKKDLHILSVESDCGCTAVVSAMKTIPPGGTSAIKAHFDSRGRSGIMQKKITVKTDDLITPEMQLDFHVEVQNDPFHTKPGQQPGGE